VQSLAISSAVMGRTGMVGRAACSFISLDLGEFNSEDAESLVESIQDGLVEVSELERLNVEGFGLRGLSGTLPEDVMEEGSIWRDLANIFPQAEKGIKITESLSRRL
jgi:hypothetical protein